MKNIQKSGFGVPILVAGGVGVGVAVAVSVGSALAEPEISSSRFAGLDSGLWEGGERPFGNPSNPYQITLETINAAAMGDIDNDGDSDVGLVGIANGVGSVIQILINEGGGIFSLFDEFEISIDLTLLATTEMDFEDTDNDGDSDLIVIGTDPMTSNKAVFVLPNQIPQMGGPSSPDLNQDGEVNGADLANLLSNWGPVE